MDTTREETEYKWLEAAKSYEQTLRSEPATGSAAAEHWQKIGYCYDLASRQAANIDDFKSLRQLSVEAYEKAGSIFIQEASLENEGKSAYCLARAEYVASWLASDFSEKARRLDKCRILAKKAMHAFKTSEDNLYYGKTANLLTRCLFERLYLLSNGKEKTEIAQEGMDCANDAILALSKSDGKEELVIAFSLASIQAWYLSIIGETEEDRKNAVSKSASYAQGALELSKEVSNAYSNAMSRWAGVWSNLYYAEDIEVSLKYAREMLEQASIARDNFLRGMASYLLADATDFKVYGEANPNIRKQLHEEIIKYSENSVRYLNLVFQDSSIAEAYLLPAETYSTLASDFAVNLSEKLVYSKKAVNIGKKGLDYATRSGSPEAMMGSLHGLSKAYYYHSRLEPRNDYKPELLMEALRHRKEFIRITKDAFPSNFWEQGVGLIYAAQIETALSRLEKDEKRKINLLREAIADMEQGVSCTKNWAVFRVTPSLIASVAGFEDTLGGTLDEGYVLTAESGNLTRANEVYIDAAEDFKKVDLPSRVAESYWKIARNLDGVSSYDQAARNFENAFAAYKAAAQRIIQFSDFYLDYASYMKAWSEIEFAKRAHSDEKYEVAMQHYEKTSQLLRQSKSWMYLSLNFYAWSLFEQAEDLSRKENSRESIEAFKKAAKFLQESKRILNIKLEGLDKKDEIDLVKRIIGVTDTRTEYSHGRIAIEEAKVLDNQGDHIASSEKYSKAAEIFQKISIVEAGEAAEEAKPLFYLCQAWQKMNLAEARSNPTMYKEAAELFKQANEHSSKESTSLMTLGHSSFCKAMEAGTEFETTQTMAAYEQTTRYMDIAANYYLKAGFEAASDYAKATQRLFDAYVFMESAKRDRDPEKQARFYSMAEKVLGIAAEYFTKAGIRDKTNQVQRLLRKVKDERALALSLGEIFHAPTVTSSTATFSTISPSKEMPVGLERFEQADIQAKIVQHETDIKIGENVTIEIQMVNVGKEPVSLIRIDDVAPAGFQIVDKPENCTLEDKHLVVKGKRLNPLKTEEIKISLRAFKTGSMEVKPKVISVDWAGHQMSSNPEPVAYNVTSVALPDRVSTGYTDLDNLLLGGIPENYAVVLTSPSNDVRELLIKKFLEVGTRKGETTFYLTVEPGEAKALAEEFQSSFYLFVCNPRADAIVKSQPNIFKLKGLENLTDIDIALTKAFRELDSIRIGTRRACIKIVSDVLLQHHAVTTRKWLSQLLPDLRAKGFTTIAVVNPHMHPPEEVQAILGLFEGEIGISERETEKGIEKILRVRRLYNQRYLDSGLTLTSYRLEQ